MQIVNRTPHVITLKNSEGEIVTIDAPIRVIRVSQTVAHGGELNGIPVHVSQFGEVIECDNNKEGSNPSPLPDPVEGVWYVVSGMVASALPNRKDLLTPFIIERDATGKPTAWQLGTTHADWQAEPVAEPNNGLSIEEYIKRAQLDHLSPIGRDKSIHLGWRAIELPIQHFTRDELIQVAKVWMKQFYETDRALGGWQSGQYSL